MSRQPQNFNSADEAQVQGRKRKADLQWEQHLADMKAILSTPEGRRVWTWFAEQAGLNRSSFTGNSETFFREGGRNLGLIVLASLREACLDLVHLAEREAKEKDHV